MKFLTTVIARILFAFPFFVFGLNHFIFTHMMSATVPDFIPVKVFFVYFAGALLILSSISIVMLVKTRLACLLLAAMLILFVLCMHLPTLISGGEYAQLAMMGLLKDTSLAGGALLMAGLYGNKMQ